MAKADMYLLLEGRATGKVKGESTVTEHFEEIDISGWGWGMTGSSALAGGGASARSSLSDLRFTKGVDRASTQLMSVMRANEVVKKAVLTLCKAGSTPPVPYMTITIQNGRINSYSLGNVAPGSPEMTESFSIVFEEIEVTYSTQAADGSGGASLSFNTQVHDQ